MSEVSQSMADEPAVVGEPASQPHHAAVVGEPPEELVPVLGEPVLLANGLQNDRQSVSSPSPHEPAINGVHKEPPSQAPDADAHDSTPSSNEANSSADVELTHIVDVLSEPTPPEREISMENPFSALDESSGDTDLKESIEGEEPSVVNEDDTVVTHIVDVPSEPSPPEREISTENPFSVLDEGSGDTDLKESVEGEEPAFVDEDVTAAKEVDPSKDLGDSCVASTSLSEQKGVTKGLGSSAESSEKALSTLAHEKSTRESEEKNNVVGREINISEPTVADAVDPQLADTSTKELHLGESSSEKTGEKAFDATNITGEEKGQEDEKIKVEHLDSKDEEISKGEVYAKEGEVVDTSSKASRSKVEQAVSRETVLPDSFSSEKVSGKEDGLDQTAPHSSLQHIEKDASAGTFPVESSNFRAADVETRTGDQPPSDEDVLGENGTQHDGAPLEREQFLTEDEKPSSRFKVPVICTLVIAVVGVAVAAISRSRR